MYNTGHRLPHVYFSARSLIDHFPLLQTLNEMVNLGFVYPMMLLPSFPRVMWVLQVNVVSQVQYKADSWVLTCLAKAWNSLSDVPSGFW